MDKADICIPYQLTISRAIRIEIVRNMCNIYTYITFMYFLSTTEFRNAFLRTIRQIIRESVRNMSIPSTKQNLNQPPITISPRMSTGHVEKFEKQSASQGQNGSNSSAVTTGTLSKKTVKPQILPTSHNVKRKYSQSKQAVEHESSEDKDTEEPAGAINQQQTTFRSRSKTISDTSGEIYLL